MVRAGGEAAFTAKEIMPLFSGLGNKNVRQAFISHNICSKYNEANIVISDGNRKLLVATGNRGKLKELQTLLTDLPLELLGLGNVGITNEIEETGITFAENAALKASGYSLLAKIPTLADDSGLEVTALNNRPGVLSARYGGTDLPFDQKIGKLLGELQKTGDTDRRARFVCSIAVANAAGEIVHSSEGVCSGTIANEPRGTNGFGYDPVFIPDGFENTFGELSDGIKGEISHRARAFCQIMPFLRLFYAI